MREICEIYVADTQGGGPPQTAGRFVLDNNKLTYELGSASDLMFRRILAEDIPVYVDGRMIDLNSKTQPNLWFAALPQHFARSSYMGAKIVSGAPIGP
jgi:hypothetical protein